MNPASDDEHSPGGSRILRHGSTAERELPPEDVCVEQISAYIEQHLGPVQSVLHEIVSEFVHIDVHVVAASDDVPLVRLVTSGMSDLPMTIPDDADVPRFCELMISLPGDWKLDQASMNDERWYWPIRLLKMLARLPHAYGTWLGFGHTVPNGDPAEPYAPGVPFSGAIILPPVSVSPEFHTLRINDDKEIHFFAVVPLFPGEMDLKLRRGTEQLLDRLGAKNISDVVSVNRGDASRRRFWWFG